MRKIILLLLGFMLVLQQANSQSTSNALSIRWKVDIGSPSERIKSNIIFIGSSDINNDGFEEVIAVSGGSITSILQPSNNIVYVYSKDGELLWEKKIDDEITSVYVKDIDRDDFQEIIVSAGQMREEISRGRIYIIMENGEIIRTLHSTSIVNSIHITDIDGDKLQDIIGGSPARVRLFDSFGMNKWNLPTYKNINVVNAGNVLGDSVKEVLAGSDELIVIDNLGSKVTSITANSLSNEVNDEINSIHTINTPKEAYPYIVVTTKKSPKIHVLKAIYNQTIKKYQLIRKWDYDVGDSISYLGVSDLEPDGYNEILVGTNDGYFFVLNGVGDLAWSFKANGGIMDADVSDVNTDGEEDVILGSISGTIYVLSSEEGGFMWRYDLAEPISNVEVADLEGDPYKEIIVGTLTRAMYVFEVNRTFTDLHMANTLYLKAQELYVISQYTLSLSYLQRARELYVKVDDRVGIRKSDGLIEDVNDKLSGLEVVQANVYYEKAKEFFIEGEYLQAKRYAEMSKLIYDKIRDTQNSIKVELLLLRIDKMIMQIEVISTTTLTPIIEADEGEFTMKSAYFTLIIAAIVLAAGLYLKRRKSSGTMETIMTEYEKDLEKVIEEDLSELKDMNLGGGESEL